jgi:hypothetical protein
MLSAMSLGDWFRRLFSPSGSSSSPEDEAAEREEYGNAYPGTGSQDSSGSVVAGGAGGFAGLEDAQAAEAEEEEFEAPPDPAP